MSQNPRSLREGAALNVLDRLLTNTDSPLGNRIRAADTILDRALAVSRQLRMQLATDYGRYLHENPEALKEHREWQEAQGKKPTPPEPNQ